MGLFSGEDIGIDLGTSTILVYVKNKGIIINEPSVVAIDNTTGRMLAIGEEARRMLGRTPGNISAIRPLREGVIADYDITERMLKHFITKAIGKRLFFKPRVMICIPAVITGVEERAVRQAALAAGARESYLIEEPIAAAFGAGLDISQPGGNMVVDIGGGTSDIAVMSLGGIVCSNSTRIGGDKFDEAIARYIRKQHNMLIGEKSAEEVKITIGSASPAARWNDKMTVRGRNLVTGLPGDVELTTEAIYEAIEEPLEAIISAIREVLERTPPELASDIMYRGVILTGGGALLDGLDALITRRTGLPTHIPDDSVSCVARGTGLALRSMGVLKKSRYSRRRRI